MVLTDEPPLYRDLMRMKPDALTPNAGAVRAGVSRTVWTDMRRHGNPSRRTLEKLLIAAGSSLAEFEALRVGDAPRGIDHAANALGDFAAGAWRAAPLPPVPLLASMTGGDWHGDRRSIDVIEVDFSGACGQLARPPSLASDRDAYAVTIFGDSMWPRFRSGRQLLVSPAAPIAVEDDVLVRLAGHGSARASVLIKELVGRSASEIQLRQFTPDSTFPVQESMVAAIHKIVGEAI
jgi:hypothetical protein